MPDEWFGAADAIAARGWRRVMVLGPNGAGKSTFCRWLAARLPDTALLDADVGQQHLGPPATMALAPPGSASPLVRFVGTTSPLAEPMALIATLAALVADAGGGRLVCNTSGLVAGPGVALKTFKIDVLRPDVLVAVAPGTEVEPILAANAHLPALRLRPSPLARDRSAGRRRTARQAAFARHLDGAAELRLPTAAVVIQRRPPPAVPVEGLLCGLADGRGILAGIAIALAMDAETVGLFTPVPEGAAKLLRFGGMYLDREGRERGLVQTRKGPR